MDKTWIRLHFNSIQRIEVEAIKQIFIKVAIGLGSNDYSVIQCQAIKKITILVSEKINKYPLKR